MLQLKLIALYSYLCDVYDNELRWYCQRFSPNGNEGEFTDQELLCGYLFALMEGQKPQVKSIWKFLHDYWLDWFPSLPSYVGFNRRLNRLSGVMEHLVNRIATDMAQSDEQWIKDMSIIDSFPIMTCSSRRKGKVARELADKGYCATKKMHYYGLKLHFIGFHRPGGLPLPEQMKVSPASWHDLTAMRQEIAQMKGRAIFADKIYIDKDLQQHLNNQGSHLYTPVKLIKGQSEWERQFNAAADKLFSTAVSRIRQPVESIFNWLEEKVGLQNASKVRSTKGLIVHTFGKIAAAFLPIFFNW
jgi:hypothetical protein